MTTACECVTGDCEQAGVLPVLGGQKQRAVFITGIRHWENIRKLNPEVISFQTDRTLLLWGWKPGEANTDQEWHKAGNRDKHGSTSPPWKPGF